MTVGVPAAVILCVRYGSMRCGRMPLVMAAG